MLEHLTRALLDPAPSRVEQPRVAVVASEAGESIVEEIPEPIVLRPRRGGDLLAELTFLDP